MKEQIVGYRKQIDDIINSEDSNADYSKIIDKHLVWIGFFQHERLVHLLVTILFALMSIIVLGVNILGDATLSLLILQSLLIVLLVPYVFHYYTLENETQKMYVQYEKLLELEEKYGK